MIALWGLTLAAIVLSNWCSYQRGKAVEFRRQLARINR